MKDMNLVKGMTPDGRWVKGYYVHFEDFMRKREAHRITTGTSDSMPEADGYDFFASWEDVNPDTLSRFSGQTDKNGNEVFEGDILRGDFYPFHDEGVDNYLGVVFFNSSEYLWEVMKFVAAKSERSGISNFINDAFYDIDFSKMEIIGNIWETKGLFRDTDEEVMKWFKSE